jgi:hypothetical protein
MSVYSFVLLSRFIILAVLAFPYTEEYLYRRKWSIQVLGPLLLFLSFCSIYIVLISLRQENANT